MTRLLSACVILAEALHAQSNTVAAQFERVMGEPKELVNALVNLPWNPDVPGSLAGFRPVEPGQTILAHFISRSMEGSMWRTRQYNLTFEAVGRPQTWYEFGADKIEPSAGTHYNGPVYVLTSPSTRSAAEDFLIPLKMAKRIIIVGEPTCGSTGQPLQFSIYGATARICTKWERFPDGTEFVEVGVVPDVKTARTKKDVASGRDAVLETAIGLASK